MGISSISFAPPSATMKQERHIFPSNSHYSTVLLCQVCDKFYPRMLCETFFIKRFVADRIVLTSSTDCTSLHVRAFLTPYNRKAKCSAEKGDITHILYPWPLALRDLLFMNKHPTGRLRITGCGRKILFIYISLCLL